MSNQPNDPTQQLPEQPTTPFKVEPATPVPDDDLVAPADEVTPPPPASMSAPMAAPTYEGPLVTVQKGPRPFTVMLGLLSMVVAGWVLTSNLTEADLDLRVLGPTAFGAMGALLVVVGLIGGVVSGRGRA